MTATGSGNGKKKTEVSDNKLFPQYSSNIDGSNIIDPEGIERLFNDLEISSHSIQALSFMWAIDARSMGQITEQEWHNAKQLTTLSSLKSFILDKFTSIQKDEKSFESFYKFLFDFAKHDRENQKVIDLDVCLSLLEIIFNSDSTDEVEVEFSKQKNSHYPHLKGIIQYLEEHSEQVKCLNKDQWNNLVLFSKSISPDFSNWNENSAWPLLLDSYVDWAKKR